MNGLIHLYIYNKHDFMSADEIVVELVMDQLNHRPRKCLGFMLSFERLFDHSIALQS